MGAKSAKDGSRALERARESFLSSATADDALSNWVRISWERSSEAGVDVNRPQPTFVENSRESALTRAARPVMAGLAAEIENEPVCLILTDPKGTVLDRRGGDRQLLTQLDRVNLAPGFQYSESQVGTNGIGTALEVGGPVLVKGAEHYSEQLTQFSCAGALVTHPVTGNVLGVVDITTDADNTNSLLLSFAKLAARRIQERLLEEANALEATLLGDYYAACKHSGRPVIAIGDDVFMMNALTHQYFDAQDQAAIIAQSQEVRGSAYTQTLLAELPSGIRARMSYQPSFAGDTLAGGIILVREQSTRSPASAASQPPRLRGVVGDSPIWQRVARDVLSSYTSREWLVLEGEDGVGKSHLLRAAHSQASSARPIAIHDATSEAAQDVLDAIAADLESGSDLIIRNADALPADSLDALVDLLQPYREDPSGNVGWVAVTMQAQPESGPFATRLLPLFSRTISVPPLRHHADDIPQLVRFFLEKTGATALSLSSATLNQLARLPWPGNVNQLRAVLEAICKRQRSGVVELADLPPECRATTRRSLSRMESLERDAIVEALLLHDGDKRLAAEALGMSRATIYRKIRDFGIVGT